MNRRAILPLLLLAAPAIATSANPDHGAANDPEESRLSKLAEQMPKASIPKLRDYLFQKLEIAYQIALLNAHDAEHRQAIEDAQKQWLAFYEAQRRVAALSSRGGSFAAPAAMQQSIYHLRQRIYTLITPFMQGWQEPPPTPARRHP